MKDTRKDKPRVKKLEKEKMLSSRTSQGVSFHEGCHTWRRKWIK